MSDKINERLEKEALESLVASDLSAKMKQWRQDDAPPPKRGADRFLVLLLLLIAAAGLWRLWPAGRQSTPVSEPAPPPVNQQNIPSPERPALPDTQPVAKRPTPDNRPYLALAQSSYKAPAFSTDVRGAGNTGDEARKALDEGRPQDALKALKNTAASFETDATYLRAHAYFMLKKYPQSAELFAGLKSSVRYGEAAQWYEILALLPAYDKSKALIMSKLDRIYSDPSHTFYREARKLSADLQRL